MLYLNRLILCFCDAVPEASDIPPSDVIFHVYSLGWFVLEGTFDSDVFGSGVAGFLGLSSSRVAVLSTGPSRVDFRIELDVTEVCLMR